MAMNYIPSEDVLRIYRAWEKRGSAEGQRRYLGASIAGHECDMHIWLQFRGALAEKFEGRMYRLFDRGKREEAVFAEDLRAIGCEVKEFGEDGDQFGISDFGGHFAGHLDGVARGFKDSPSEWRVVEYKTHSDSSFRKLAKEGVRKAKPMHFAQMQIYMRGTGLKSAFYLAVNKDNDELYSEIVPFDERFAEDAMSRIKRIIDTATPDRCANRPDYFVCKTCPSAHLCWKRSGRVVDPSLKPECRNCCHSTADTASEGASWTCRLGHPCCSGMVCSDHIWLPAFVDADIVDADKTSILYCKDGVQFSNGGKKGFWSEELQRIEPSQLDGAVKLKEATSGTVSSTKNLEIAYRNATVLFEGNRDELRGYSAGSLVVDFSKPTTKEEHGGVQYYEYDGGVLVTIDGEKCSVKAFQMPF